MVSKNQYFLKGVLFLTIGSILLLRSMDFFDNLVMVMYILSVILIYKGIQLIKNVQTKLTGQLLIAAGVFLIIIYSNISLRFILSVAFLGYGLYLLVIKSKVFIKNKGVFKDSRSNVYIKEKFSNVTVNNNSNNLQKVDVVSIFSTVDLCFMNSDIPYGNMVDFKVKAYMSQIKINTNSSWNVILDGRYIRKIEGIYNTINIDCKNVLSVIDII